MRIRAADEQNRARHHQGRHHTDTPGRPWLVVSCAILLIGRRNRPERSPHTANTANYDIIMKLTAFHNYVIVLLYGRVLRLDARCVGPARGGSAVWIAIKLGGFGSFAPVTGLRTGKHELA